MVEFDGSVCSSMGCLLGLGPAKGGWSKVKKACMKYRLERMNPSDATAQEPRAKHVTPELTKVKH
ncbi:hypothetical protein J6590_054020 [Homalodisca vitripennis]|nr:hypothetical protein J6590_054020 [Homalodisca vitripennis]